MLSTLLQKSIGDRLTFELGAKCSTEFRKEIVKLGERANHQGEQIRKTRNQHETIRTRGGWARRRCIARTRVVRIGFGTRTGNILMIDFALDAERNQGKKLKLLDPEKPSWRKV